tara:strand:- start:518 stop:1783 length:1266 start_codon:yes stop_codon:yes gene_type:complete
MISTPLSFGREATVELFSRSGRPTSVVKDYWPQHHRLYGKMHRELFSNVPFYATRLTEDRRVSLSRKEAALLSYLSSQGFAPRLREYDQRKLRIRMSYVPLETFQQAIVSGLNPLEATELMVSHLAQLHKHCNGNMAELSSAIGEFGVGIRTINAEREAAKWDNYLRTTDFYLSPVFEDYCQDQGIDKDDPKLNEDRIREHLSRFHDSLGLPGRGSLTVLMQEERKFSLCSTFIWGEAGPQNLFYDPENPGKVMAIDFPRVRRGPGDQVDLVNVLYNLHRDGFSLNEEYESLQMARKYFESVGIPEEEIPLRLGLLPATRVKELIRKLQSTSRKNSYEISRAQGKIRDLSEPYRNGGVKETAIMNLTDLLEQVCEAYGSEEGEGTKMLREVVPNSNPFLGSLVFNFIDYFQSHLSRTEVLR